jgi:putative membrane protein
MQDRSVWKGIVAGALGGLAATFVMTQFQNGWTRIAEKVNPDEGNDDQKSHGDPATVKAADKVLVATTGEHVPAEQKETVGTLVHYGFGALAGVTYGLLSEFVPQARAGFGSAFGSALFVGADEIGVPLAGLAPSPAETPAKVHVYAWVSHLVYGAALEGSRRAARAALAKVA